MTNEELAAAVQAGRAGYGELWEQVSRFVRQQAHKYYTLHAGTCLHAGVEPDDLIQCGFLALRDAVQAFEPERGYTLLAYMKYPLQNRFREACGIRTSKRDPLLSCASLDAPAGEEGVTTLGDLQPSQSAAQAMENAMGIPGPAPQRPVGGVGYPGRWTAGHYPAAVLEPGHDTGHCRRRRHITGAGKADGSGGPAESAAGAMPQTAGTLCR